MLRVRSEAPRDQPFRFFDFILATARSIEYFYVRRAGFDFYLHIDIVQLPVIFTVFAHGISRATLAFANIYSYPQIYLLSHRRITIQLSKKTRRRLVTSGT